MSTTTNVDFRASLRELEAQVGVLARRIRRVINERAESVDPSLSPLGYSVLEQLHRDGTHRQTDLVCSLESEKGAISRAVQHLIELGFVERLADPTDGRAHQVQVNAEGSKRLEAVAEARWDSFTASFADWGPEELDQLVASLTHYNETIEGARSRPTT